MAVEAAPLTYRTRIARLRETKLEQTAEKQRVIGSMDYDDWAIVLPPEASRDITELIGPSGAPMRDVKIKGVGFESNHPSGGFYGPELVGKNYERLLEAHPVYLDPMSSLAGAYMANFFSYRKPHWNPDLDTSRFNEAADRYHLIHSVGGVQHFCQDLSIGLGLGWGGLLEKIDTFQTQNGEACRPFYTGLRHVIAGTQDWIQRHIDRATELAEESKDEDIRDCYMSLATTNRAILNDPPATFLQACQWILWFQLIARMYDGSGSLGAIDQLLLPFYKRDTSDGVLSDEEAVFHLACLLVRDTGYSQIGGYDAEGNDTTNRVSYLVLDAVEAIRVPANVGVCVGERIDRGLLIRGVEMQFRHKNGIPKFLGVDNTAAGYARNGYPIEDGYARTYSGCHWSAVPGREYTMNDMIKINLARIFEVAFDEYTQNRGPHGIDGLWGRFESHLDANIEILAKAIDFHLAHMHGVFPELPLDLLCHGPIEQGLDISAGSVDLYNIGIDAAGLSVAADSFAAIAQRVVREQRLSWSALRAFIIDDWNGPDGEQTRQMMKSVPRYGFGDSIGDEWAVRISRRFAESVKRAPTPNGVPMVPGLFSWALAPSMGKRMGATPDGRHAGDPLAHGCNPSPGFRSDNAATALAVAVASVQPGYGQAAPLQLDFDPGITPDGGGVELVSAIIETHFRLGGTQINLNIMDADRILEAYEDPSKHPDLVVRVTGFSAYFASLSDDLRRFVVEHMVGESA